MPGAAHPPHVLTRTTAAPAYESRRRFPSTPATRLAAAVVIVLGLGWVMSICCVVAFAASDVAAPSDAIVSSDYARRRGVPEYAIMLESEGRTTSESMRIASALLRARHATSVVLVSDPFHTFRLWILARRLGLRPRTSPTRTSPIGGNRGANVGYIFSESLKAPVAFFIE